MKNNHTIPKSKTFYDYNSTVLIENCSFLGNIGPGEEFNVDFGFITVKNSICDKSDKTSGSVTLNNVQNLNFIHNLSHFSLILCETEFFNFKYY